MSEENDLRLEALRYATHAAERGEAHTETIARAVEYLTFLRQGFGHPDVVDEVQIEGQSDHPQCLQAP